MSDLGYTSPSSSSQKQYHLENKLTKRNLHTQASAQTDNFFNQPNLGRDVHQVEIQQQENFDTNQVNTPDAQHSCDQTEQNEQPQKSKFNQLASSESQKTNDQFHARVSSKTRRQNQRRYMQSAGPIRPGQQQQQAQSKRISRQPTNTDSGMIKISHIHNSNQFLNAIQSEQEYASQDNHQAQNFSVEHQIKAQQPQVLQRPQTSKNKKADLSPYSLTQNFNFSNTPNLNLNTKTYNKKQPVHRNIMMSQTQPLIMSQPSDVSQSTGGHFYQKTAFDQQQSGFAGGSNNGGQSLLNYIDDGQRIQQFAQAQQQDNRGEIMGQNEPMNNSNNGDMVGQLNQNYVSHQSDQEQNQAYLVSQLQQLQYELEYQCQENSRLKQQFQYNNPQQYNSNTNLLQSQETSPKREQSSGGQGSFNDNLRKQIKQLRAGLKYAQEELQETKRCQKLTKIKEIEAETEAYRNECIRLRQIIENQEQRLVAQDQWFNQEQVVADLQNQLVKLQYRHSHVLNVKAELELKVNELAHEIDENKKKFKASESDLKQRLKQSELNLKLKTQIINEKNSLIEDLKNQIFKQNQDSEKDSKLQQKLSQLMKKKSALESLLAQKEQSEKALAAQLEKVLLDNVQQDKVIRDKRNDIRSVLANGTPVLSTIPKTSSPSNKDIVPPLSLALQSVSTVPRKSEIHEQEEQTDKAQEENINSEQSQEKATTENRFTQTQTEWYKINGAGIM